MPRPFSIALALCFALSLPAFGQQAPPPTPPQHNLPHETPLNPALPTVFIVGDSTARNSADLGWADHFAQFFDTSRVNVANRAIAGRSARSYIDEGHWATTLAEMKSGDFLLLQMGHNDGGDLGGAKPRGDLKGVGDDTQDVAQTVGPYAGKIETIHTFGWYLRKMIDDAKAKGVHPILLTPTIRNIWTTGADGKPHIERNMGSYNDWVRQVAAQEHIPVADVSTQEADFLEQQGQTATAHFFPIDHTHTSAEGAVSVALSVFQALAMIHSALIAYKAPDQGALFLDMMASAARDGGEEETNARFRVAQPKLEQFANQIIAANIPDDTSTGFQKLIPLPPEISPFSPRNDVMLAARATHRFVLFFTFSGILNSYAGYVYSQDGTIPPKDIFGYPSFEQARIAPHWFWYSSRN